MNGFNEQDGQSVGVLHIGPPGNEHGSGAEIDFPSLIGPLVTYFMVVEFVVATS